MSKYTVKYRTFDQFMYDVEDDLSSYTDAGLIDRDKVLKIIQKCNSTLSIKINPKRNKLLTIVDRKVALPPDFKLFSAAYICTGTKTYQSSEIEQTTTTTTTGANQYCQVCELPECGCNTAVESTCVVKTNETSVIEITDKMPLYLTDYKEACQGCDDIIGTGALDEIFIEVYKGNHYAITNLVEGELYIEYISEMTTKDDILILDHPLVIEYYEYAVKERILEDIWLNGREDVQNRYRMMEEKHRRAKIEAIRFVRMPDFKEIKKVYDDNRKRFARKYFNPLYYKQRGFLHKSNYNF